MKSRDAIHILWKCFTLSASTFVVNQFFVGSGCFWDTAFMWSYCR